MKPLMTFKDKPFGNFAVMFMDVISNPSRPPDDVLLARLEIATDLSREELLMLIGMFWALNKVYSLPDRSLNYKEFGSILIQNLLT